MPAPEIVLPLLVSVAAPPLSVMTLPILSESVTWPLPCSVTAPTIASEVELSPIVPVLRIVPVSESWVEAAALRSIRQTSARSCCSH
jgi:hypothetical protein